MIQSDTEEEEKEKEEDSEVDSLRKAKTMIFFQTKKVKRKMLKKNKFSIFFFK